jgi:hypothetical protein
MRITPLVSAIVLAATLAACKAAPPPSGSVSSATPEPAASSRQPDEARTASAEPRNVFTGAVVETMNSGGYTYLHLQSDSKDVWAAAPEFDAKTGETLSVSLDMPMQNFQSRTMNRTFPLLYFVQEVGRNGHPVAAAGRPDAPALMPGHGTPAAAPSVQRTEPPAGGMAIADVFAKKASLAGKPVTVRGTVVKFNGGILDRNWLHVQDGSGTVDAHDNDLTITTDASVKVGDVVTMTGVVGTNKDFGAGYAYDVIVEQATPAK